MMPAGFHVIAKPIGPICNLDCAYCYYLAKERLYPSNRHWRMSDETLETYVRQYLAAQADSVEETVFGWQGGEPTLLGVEFFRRAVELQARYCRPGQRWRNTLQTNGILLDDAWCEFFKANDFLVGLSIDGPADLHDKYRRDKQGRPTFERVVQGMQLLRKHGVAFNALVTVHRHNGDHGRRVYRFLSEAGVEFMQLIPIVERGEASAGNGGPVTPRSVGPAQWGRFLVDVFEEWVHRDVGRVFVQIFDEALAAWTGEGATLCIFQETCGRALVLEHNGDLYSCDHFVDPDHRLGNIHEVPLAELVARPEQARFGQDKRDGLPRCCLDCAMRFACQGECPRNRFVCAADGPAGLNYLCEGYRLFFDHVRPCMGAMAEELGRGRPAANVMYRINAERQRVLQQGLAGGRPVGRNDPCPCGSGRKYKACCMRRRSPTSPFRQRHLPSG